MALEDQNLSIGRSSHGRYNNFKLHVIAIYICVYMYICTYIYTYIFCTYVYVHMYSIYIYLS